MADQTDVEGRYGHLVDNFTDDTRLEILGMILKLSPKLIEQEIASVQEYAEDLQQEYKKKIKVYTWLLGAMKTCPKRKI